MSHTGDTTYSTNLSLACNTMEETGLVAVLHGNRESYKKGRMIRYAQLKWIKDFQINISLTSDCPGIIELTGKFTPFKLNTVLLQTHVLKLPISLQTHTQLSHKYWINRNALLSVTQEWWSPVKVKKKDRREDTGTEYFEYLCYQQTNK